MNIRNRSVYKKLLSENDDEFSKSLLYYLSLKGKRNLEKRQFVENLLESEGEIYMKPSMVGSNYEIDLSKVSAKVRDRIIASYYADNGLVSSQRDEEEMLDQIDKIF